MINRASGASTLWVAVLAVVVGFAGLSVFSVIGASAIIRSISRRQPDFLAYASPQPALPNADPAEAIRFFSGRIRQDPQSSGGYFGRALAYYQDHRLQNALKDANRGLELDPNNMAGYFDRAQIYASLNQPAKAVQDMRSVTQLAPGNSTAWGDLGWYQYLAGDMRGAMENSRKALRMDPNATYAEYNLALCYAVQGDWPDAEKTYNSALQRSDPRTTGAALQDIKDARKLHPNSAALQSAERFVELAISNR